MIPLGEADIKRPGSDVSLVSYAKSVAVALKAADVLEEQYGVSAEVIDLRSVRPLDVDAIVTSVAKTNRCVVVEENWPFCGVGAQIVDEVQQRAFDDLDAPIMRVTQLDMPVPYNKHLEKLTKPTPERVVEAVKQVTYA